MYAAERELRPQPRNGRCCKLLAAAPCWLEACMACLRQEAGAEHPSGKLGCSSTQLVGGSANGSVSYSAYYH